MLSDQTGVQLFSAIAAPFNLAVERGSPEAGLPLTFALER